MGITIQRLLQSHSDALVRAHPLSRDMLRAAMNLRDCQTAAMGAHIRRCPAGHVREIVNNSCRHRCCQKCCELERARWLNRWQQRLLPVPHHHVVFTVPHELLDLWRYNKRLMGKLLFAAASQALQELLADPKYCGGRVGLLASLHTWSQTLAAHPHLHVLVTAGGLDKQSGRWLSPAKACLLPRKVLMIIFRGKFRALVLKAISQGELTVPAGTTVNRWIGELNRLGRIPWNVKIFDRYEHGGGVATYLAHYLRGGPISNKRLVKVDGDKILFRYRVPTQAAGDRTRQGLMSLPITDFLRRLLEHVPPRGMQTVRGYGLYAGNQHSQLTQAFEALGSTRPDPSQDVLDVQSWLESLGRDASAACCPVCGRKLEVVEYSPRRRWSFARSPPGPLTDPLTNDLVFA